MNDISKEFINAYKGKDITDVVVAFVCFAELNSCNAGERAISLDFHKLYDDMEIIMIELYKSLMPETVKSLDKWGKINILNQVSEEIDCETYEVSKQKLIKALEY